MVTQEELEDVYGPLLNGLVSLRPRAYQLPTNPSLLTSPERKAR